jgi:hypothetical protein
MRFWLLVLVLVVSMLALCREIAVFACHEIRSATKLFFVKNPALPNLPELRMRPYDVHYNFAFVPFSTSLASFCADVLHEVLTVCKTKYPIVTSIHLFSRKPSQSTQAPCVKIATRSATVVVVPLCENRCFVQDTCFLKSLCIVSHPDPQVIVSADQFLFVSIRNCRAWNC